MCLKMSATGVVEQQVKYFMLTGVPGVGKTTLIKKICDILSKNGVSQKGYYTEELRNASKRVGFDVVTLNGERGPLARIDTGSGRFKVGRYNVLIESFENLVLPIFNNLQQSSCPVLVIDEIGKMELFSKNFQKKVEEVFKSDQLILGTVPSASSDQLVRKIKTNPRTRVIEVTHSNRNDLAQTIASDILSVLNYPKEAMFVREK
ncbi:nucleoside-triphosphatase THEP1 [Anabrus simplex]|uniref:nucleoside-triphosphatase THEP1 n=1 Tax=Anabrus simplex TaxID=316456 RepID=UPI0035A27175